MMRISLALALLLVCCGGKVAEHEPTVEERAQASAPLPIANGPVCAELARGTYWVRKVRKMGGDECGPVRFDTTVTLGPGSHHPDWTCVSKDDPATCTLDETCTLVLDDQTGETLITRQKYVTSGDEIAGWSEVKTLDAEGRVIKECGFQETLKPVP
jgi:hypothetical protein